jgi:hypothetical protein
LEKVYFRGTDGYFPFEIMLYDFSLGVNDTMWYFRDMYEGNYDIVEMVDSVNIGTDYYKRIQLTNGRTWIEGIGDLNGLISAAVLLPLCGTIYTRDLLCFYKNSSLVYQPENAVYKNCYYATTGIKPNVISREITVNPNPASDFITISCNTGHKYSVEIINIQGKQILGYVNFSGDQQINMLGLMPGLYFIKITRGQDYAIYKIMKE